MHTNNNLRSTQYKIIVTERTLLSLEFPTVVAKWNERGEFEVESNRHKKHDENSAELCVTFTKRRVEVTHYYYCSTGLEILVQKSKKEKHTVMMHGGLFHFSDVTVDILLLWV
jgi:hypothetical protein